MAQRKTYQQMTVRRDVVSVRRENGLAVADILSCGHEFRIDADRNKYKLDRICKICTANMLQAREASRG
jgi:hypothetical protein